MNTKKQDEIIRECMYLWPKSERFPVFEPDLYHWFAKSNDHHRSNLGSGETMLDALLEAALKGKKGICTAGEEGIYDLVIKCLRYHLNNVDKYVFDPGTESNL